VENKRIVRRLRDRILQKYLDDEDCTRLMRSDGVFERVVTEGNRKPLNCQTWFMKHDA
jgi:polyphosphate kinase